MKSIIVAVICLCVTYASADDLRKKLIANKFFEIRLLKFPQDPECGMFSSDWFYNTLEEADGIELLWMMSVSKKNGSKHLCDGILIYPDVLMTTAHCVENEVNEELIVTRKSKVHESYNRGNEERIVSEIHINPAYRACSRRNNFAILILSRPFVLNDYVKVVCLPSSIDSYYTGYCIKKLMEDQVLSEHERDHDHCGDRVFMASNSSNSIAKASCEQENGTNAFIKQTQSYALSCELSSTLKKFYYLGSMVSDEVCGPNSVRHQFYDTIYKFMPWMHRVLESRFIYLKADESLIYV